jgi:hypothetical protein
MSRLDTTDKNNLPHAAFAFPEQRKEPLENASHVRNAIARFDQVTGVTDGERDEAWKRILAAGRTFRVVIHATDWRDLPGGHRKHPQ